MQDQLPPVRKVVTENDAEGKSYFLSDGPLHRYERLRSDQAIGFIIFGELQQAPTFIQANDDIHTHQGIMPPKNGTVLRIIDYPPDPADPIELKRQFDAMFSRLYKDAGHDLKEGEHPGMHITSTVDYAIVLFGANDGYIRY
jgi:hypothetical protein